MANPEIVLWRSVIAQAFIDASNKTHTSADRLARAEARNWLLEDTPGFRAICDAADVTPHIVRRNAQRLQALGWPVERTAVGKHDAHGVCDTEIEAETSEDILAKATRRKKPVDEDEDEDLDDGRPLDEMMCAPQACGVFA